MFCHPGSSQFFVGWVEAKRKPSARVQTARFALMGIAASRLHPSYNAYKNPPRSAFEKGVEYGLARTSIAPLHSSVVPR
jgi:hypothetical protein